jgi:thiamine-phosphate pyrophosphorylase
VQRPANVLDEPEEVQRLQQQLRICVLLDPDQTAFKLDELVAGVLRGGATAIQVRSKARSDRSYFELAQATADRCREAGVLCIVNDRVDIAIAAGADGVHLGVTDLPVAQARALAGPSFVIGFSPETDQEATDAASQGASYLGVGPAYGSDSKLDAGEPIGSMTIGRRARLSGLPTMGIGGITPDRVAPIIEAGADGVAVIGAVLRSRDPEAATRELRAAVERALGLA